MAAVGIKNCTVVSEEGQRVWVQPVCEKCGKLRNGKYNIFINKGSKSIHHEHCTSCGANYEYIVQA